MEFKTTIGDWLVLIVLSLLLYWMVGCASVPSKADLLVRYPVEGKIVWMSEDGSMKRSPYFVIDHEDFLEFLEREREVEESKRKGLEG